MMSITNSSASYKLKSLVTVLYRYRICAGNLSQEHYRGALISKFSYGDSMNVGLRLINANRGINTKAMTDMVKDDKSKAQKTVTAPPKPSFPTWAKWLLGSILSLMLPFGKQKWESWLLLEEKVEEVVEEVEMVAEVVEEVATTAEKVAEKLADSLPDNGKLKEAALFVEHVSTVTAKDAELTEEFIHKVEGLKNDMTGLGTMDEPVIEKIIAKEHAGK